MKNIKFIIITIIFLLNSCSSVEKYNAQISKKHSPDELKQDVDYAYKKLKKLHPNLYLYVSKEKLDSKFESLKNNLTKPLSSIDFYKKFTPVVTSIKQGHTSVFPSYKKQTKTEIKEKGKRIYPFRSINFTNVQNKVIVARTYGKDSTTLVGSELLAIDNEKTNDLINSFKYLNTGDGYNTTFVPNITRKRIGSYYIRTHGLKDSIQLTFKYKDSIYNKYLFSYSKKKKLKKDSIQVKKITKIEKKIIKEKAKARKKWERKYGYNKYTKENTRNLKFIISDSINTTAYLKIRGFHNGNYKDFYKETFKKIDSLKTKNLIIDLRDNLGGRLSEITDLYSYLTDKEHYFVTPFKMTKASSWMYPLFHSKSILTKSAVTLLFPLVKIAQIPLVKNINGVPHFNLSTKLKKPKKEHNYKGKIYVLINGNSFSASSVISNHLKANNRAFFVGDETGGAYNSTVAGQFADIVLPNSKVHLYFGIANLETPNKTTPDGYGVKPDKYIETTTIDKDEQLEWILNDIKTK